MRPSIGWIAFLSTFATSFEARGPSTRRASDFGDSARRTAGSVAAPLLLLASACLPPIVRGDGVANAAAPGADLAQPVERAIVFPGESRSSPTKSPTENYLPRRLYPGTYKNYCGPTPETQVKGGCIAHGWYGDAPADKVDEACQKHDVAYCNCETQLLSRQRGKKQQSLSEGVIGDEKQIPLLSSAAALRFVTKSTLKRAAHADAQYFDCINRADRELIATGVRIRAEQQRGGCSTDPNLAWFCDLNDGKGTLTAFEKVNLSIFLWDLDADDMGGSDVNKGRTLDSLRLWRTEARAKGETLKELEDRRAADLRDGIKSGRSVTDAASAEKVVSDEERILQKLAI